MSDLHDYTRVDEMYKKGLGKEQRQLRDFFAGCALAGMLAHARHGGGYHPCHGLPWKEDIAVEAYELVDAMLKARGNDG